MIFNRKPPNFDFTSIPSPCYVLDERLLRRNLEILRNIKSATGIKILCALKGFAMWSTFPLLRQYLDGATASSLHEALLCYDEYGSKAHLCAPLYFDNEFDKLCSISSHVTFNSMNQFQRYGHMARSHGLKKALRINPEYSEVATALYNPCTPGSRLGITKDAFGTLLPEGITGIHFHTLCEQNADALKRTLEVVKKKWDDTLNEIQWINMGGGHHITRSDYNVDLLIETLISFKSRYPDLQVFIEPGEAIGWQTGYLVSTVEDIVKTNGQYTAMLDVSFAAHMPDSLEMPYKPMIWGAEEPGRAKYTYRMGGLTCLAGDFMGDYAFNESLKIGDRIIFDDMIHYTMVKSTTFNGVKLPSIGIIRENGVFELVRSFGYTDYKNRLS